MKKRKIFAGLAIAAVALVGLASCGEAAQTSTPAPVASTSAPAASTPAPAATSTQELAELTKVKMNDTEYESLSAAFAAIPADSTDTYTIKLEKGIYKNIKGLSYNGKATIKIVGNTTTKYGADVVISGRGSAMGAMKTREMIEIQGTGNIILENVTLKSDYKRSESSKDAQAEVLGTDTKGYTLAYNCSFISHQDTLRTAGKAWFYGCHVEGDTDFIWMEASGSVALYEKCEIVSVYDEEASSHSSYVCAPRMSVSSKVGKGLVIYNSVVKESAEAKEKGQASYLARSPWTSGYYNQVAYINTQISDVEVAENTDSKSKSAPWYGNMITTDYPQTVVGWKMDTATATSLGISGKDYILDDATVAKEYNGRKAILNRIYNTGKQKYEQDTANLLDIDALITANKWTVDADASKTVNEGEVVGTSTVYKFDSATAPEGLTITGFAQDQTKPHYAGAAGATIEIPVNGKCYVEVYGYYSGTLEVKADTQGTAVQFFNNNSTSAEIENDYIVYDANAKKVTITAEAKSYITKIVVTEDASIVAATPVSELTISANSAVESVGVPVTFTATANKTATNKSVKWTSSDETVGTINAYTGKVSFKKAGTVTFTATALDGSGVTATKTCNPIAPTWTEAEWYTTDSTVETEEGAKEIGNFDCGSSAYKSLGSSFTFTNLAGTEITTSNGLKLNSAGTLTVATTKPGKLTVVIAHVGKTKATPIVTDGTTTVQPTTSTDSADNKTTTYVYDLPNGGAWTISRGDTAAENDPILYATMVYPTSFTQTTGINFKGGTYSGTNVKNCNSDATFKADGSEVTYELVTFKGAKSNGENNWLTFKTGNTLTFKVAGACTLKIYFYNGQNNAKVTLAGTEVTTATAATGADYKTGYEYALTGAGEVVIEATANGYIGFFEVVFA